MLRQTILWWSRPPRCIPFSLQQRLCRPGFRSVRSHAARGVAAGSCLRGLNQTGSSAVGRNQRSETEHHTQRVGELSLITLAGPEVLTLQALRPKQRGYRVFIDRQQCTPLAAICWFKLRGFARGNSDLDRDENAWPLHGQAWLSRFAGAGRLQDEGEWDKLQFLAL